MRAEESQGQGALRVLAAADIAPERVGRARLAQLPTPERALYEWVLQQFAAGSPPSAENTRVAAARLGLDPDDALGLLAREDLVHCDEAGRPLVAYPFSALERGHRVVIAGSRTVEAMCAIDALGMSAMLGLPIEIHSHDPLSGAGIRVSLQPEGEARWEPTEAGVLAGSACQGGPSFRGCCDVLNFFEAQTNAQRYLHEHPEISGNWVSMHGAIAAGRALFGDLMTADGHSTPVE